MQDPSRQTANSIHLLRLLETHDFAGMKDLFHAFFASIPYEWYTNNDIARYEGYCASVFYSYFAALGLDVTVEDSTGHGRLDMAVRSGGHVYLFEFKVVELSGSGAALAQLRGQVPNDGGSDPSRRRGVQPGDARCHCLRGGGGLKDKHPNGTNRATFPDVSISISRGLKRALGGAGEHPTRG